MFYLVYLRVDLLEWELEYEVLYVRNFLISDNIPQAVIELCRFRAAFKTTYNSRRLPDRIMLSQSLVSFAVLASPLPLWILKVPKNGEIPQTNLNSRHIP